MKEIPDFSQFEQYKAKGEVSRDTYNDPINKSTYSRFTVSGLTPLYENHNIFPTGTNNPESDKKNYTFHMRNLLQDFYHDILDNPEINDHERPDLSYRLLRRSAIVGTKDANEYRNKKLKKADKILQSYDDPHLYFEENPLLVCEIPENDDKSTFALLRGHHELRKAGKFKIDDVACEVISLSNLAASLNAYEPSKYIGRVTTASLKVFLQNQMQTSQNSFKYERAMDRPISQPRY